MGLISRVSSRTYRGLGPQKKMRRRVASKAYREGIAELSSKIFCEPSPKLEPFTFLLVENNRMLPYNKNKYYSPWHSHPPVYNFKIMARYLDRQNLFVDEHFRFKYQGWRNQYIRGKQPGFIRWKFELNEQEQALFEANKEK